MNDACARSPGRISVTATRAAALLLDRMWQSLAAVVTGWTGMWAMALSSVPVVGPEWPAALFWVGLAAAAVEQRRRRRATVRSPIPTR